MNSNKDIDVLIMCGGKCGGSTLTSTLRNAGMHCIHGHSFDCSGFSNNYGFVFTKDNIVNILNNTTKKIYIIDSYRNPIERKISSFFQNIHIHVPNYFDKNSDELINIFNEKYIYSIEEYHSINVIMDEYNVEHFNQFDFNSRYNIKEVGNMVYIKLRFSDINSWSMILSNIFEKKIIIHMDNLTENKSINNLYNLFKQNYKVPKDYLYNNLKNDVEFSIYNTEEDRNEYLKKWLEKSY